MRLLDPVLGGKIRGVIMSLYATFVALCEYVGWGNSGWYETVVTVVGASLIVLQGLTHWTDVGSDEAG